MSRFTFFFFSREFFCRGIIAFIKVMRILGLDTGVSLRRDFFCSKVLCSKKKTLLKKYFSNPGKFYVPRKKLSSKMFFKPCSKKKTLLKNVSEQNIFQTPESFMFQGKKLSSKKFFFSPFLFFFRLFYSLFSSS